MLLDKPGVWAIIIILVIAVYFWIRSSSNDKNEEIVERSVDNKTVVEITNDLEIIAAIVASIEEYTGLTSDQYVVRNVRRVVNQESLWAQRARLENIR